MQYSKNSCRILFITRSYPPKIGGMEHLSYNIISKFKSDQPCHVKTIITTQSKLFLPLFAIKAIFLSFFFRNKYNVVHLSDAVLSIVGYFIKSFLNKKVVYNIHGLDLTYPNILYQFYLKLFFKYDKLICNSKYTQSLVKNAGYNNSIIIPLGINPHSFKIPTNIQQNNIRTKLNLPPNSIIILTVGRLIKRKGVAWFIKNVFVKLPSNTYYLVVGTGKYKDIIEKVIIDTKLEKRVLLLGRVEQSKLDQIFQQSDMFIMPNIHVPGDAEGFGMVALEASAWGLPVVASRIEGITDAIINHQNGLLVESGNARIFIDTINKLIADVQYRKKIGQHAKEYTIANYNWNNIINQYYQALAP